jgi:hypothetical protein
VVFCRLCDGFSAISCLRQPAAAVSCAACNEDPEGMLPQWISPILREFWLRITLPGGRLVPPNRCLMFAIGSIAVRWGNCPPAPQSLTPVAIHALQHPSWIPP